jgi:uncharacterized membrane protein
MSNLSLITTCIAYLLGGLAVLAAAIGLIYGVVSIVEVVIH